MEWLSDLAAPVITGLVTLAGMMLANRKAAAVREAREEMRDTQRKEWEEQTTQRLDSHNEYAALFHTTVAEQNVTLARIDERLKALEAK